MKAPVKYALAFVLAVAAGHLGAIVAAPRLIMHVALTRMSQDGKIVNGFQFGPRRRAHIEQQEALGPLQPPVQRRCRLLAHPATVRSKRSATANSSRGSARMTAPKLCGS